MVSGEDKEEMNFFYLEDEEELKNKKTLVRKRIKKNVKKGDSKKEEQKEDKFSFDNEIIIGVTKKEDIKKQKKDNKKRKNKSQKKQEIKEDNKKKTNKHKNRKTKKQVINKQIEQDSKSIAKKRKISKIAKGLGICAIFIVVIVLAMFSPLFNIKSINVIGNHKISNNEIISLSQIEINENIFKISKGKVAKQIKENAYISEVKISRNLPGTITIQVEERKEAYLIEYAASYICIDKQGYILEILSDKQQLPILQGAFTESTKFVVGNRLDKEDLEKLSIVYKIMKLAEENGIANLITKIDIENNQDFKLIFEEKQKVAYIGDNTNLLNNIKWIKKIIEEEEGNQGEIFVNMDLNKENPIFRQSV